MGRELHMKSLALRTAKLEAAENAGGELEFSRVRDCPIWTFTSVERDIKNHIMAQKRKVQDAFGKPEGKFSVISRVNIH